jgi:hypothetical protein
MGVRQGPYAGADGVDDVLSAALGAFASIRDQNGKTRVLVEGLLDAALVATGLATRHNLFGLVILVGGGIAAEAVVEVLGGVFAGRGGGIRGVESLI